MQEDLNLVLDWASAAQPRPDRLQRRAGWPWLLRHARAWARLSALQAEGPHAWPCALQVLESETHRATVVSTIEALVEAGIAFRNCLGSLAHRCQSGAVRFFVVHERDSGRRAGVFSLQFEEATRLWRVGEVKGFANLHPPAPVWLLAAMASMAYSEASGRAPHASEWVDRMVACLDANSDLAGSDPDSVGAQPDTVHGV